MAHSLKEFDPERVAALETRMWQAYYSHSFFQLGALLLRLFKEQFHVSFFTAIRLGFYSGKAATVFRKSGNLEQTQDLLTHYYQILEHHAQESFNPSKAAQLELKWWLAHRYPKRYERTLSAAVAEAMAVLYGTSPTTLRKYAEHRAVAMNLRDKATHIDKVEPDWQKIESELSRSYLDLQKAVN